MDTALYRLAACILTVTEESILESATVEKMIPIIMETARQAVEKGSKETAELMIGISDNTEHLRRIRTEIERIVA